VFVEKDTTEHSETEKREISIYNRDRGENLRPNNARLCSEVAYTLLNPPAWVRLSNSGEFCYEKNFLEKIRHDLSAAALL